MNWHDRHIRNYWSADQGRWVDYPIRVPVLKPVRWEDVPAVFTDVLDPLVVVWIGPAAPFPRATRLPEPRQVNTLVPHGDMQFPGWKSFYGERVIAREQGCAWAVEAGPEVDGWHVVIWKVWTYA
jgi:hypothetical protein